MAFIKPTTEGDKMAEVATLYDILNDADIKERLFDAGLSLEDYNDALDFLSVIEDMEEGD